LEGTTWKAYIAFGGNNLESIHSFWREQLGKHTYFLEGTTWKAYTAFGGNNLESMHSFWREQLGKHI